MFTHFWIDFVTLLAVMNPIAVIPAYITLTDGLAPVARTRVLRRAILVSAAILLVFLIVGEFYMDALGVTLDAFRIAGGLVILLVGLRMVFDDGRQPDPTRETDATSRDIAVFPLAITYEVLKTAGPIHRLLGSTGTNVVARVTRLVLTALAVQVIIAGCQNVSPTSM